MTKLKAALILDNSNIKKWQLDALIEASDLIDIKVVLNCQNTTSKKDFSKNLVYYILSRMTIKNKLTEYTKYQNDKASIINFDSEYKGNWQVIPENILDIASSEHDIDVIVKFGMSLLKIEGKLKDIPVLSYHHGDPSKYRGRPAGFYELLHNEKKLGLIVQRLTNKLDAGEILAFAEARITPYSYKKSLENSYIQSKYLLRQAVKNLISETTLEIDTGGRNYRLPSNFIATYFLIKLLLNKIRHAMYWMFYEKRWNAGIVQLSDELGGDFLINSSEVSKFDINQQYSFYADPFFSVDNTKIRLEALDKKTGLGDIIELDLEDNDYLNIIASGDHYSYPFPFLYQGSEYILPEVASHSSQFFFKPNHNESDNERIYLKGLDNKRLVDATLFEHNNYWYLFFGDGSTAHSVLNLWVSESLLQPFKKHPCSPICLSPSGARMAGPIVRYNDKLLRFGQNNNKNYGASITVSEIERITPDSYEEKLYGSIKIDKLLGPHTISFNFNKGIALIDYYYEQFDLLAGIRRIKLKLSKKL